MCRLRLDQRALAECLFKQLDQPPQLDSSRFAEVNHFVRARLVAERRDDAGNDVVNVSVIAFRLAVAI